MKFWTKGLVLGATMAMALPALAVTQSGTTGSHPGTPLEKTEKVEKMQQYEGVVKHVDTEKKMLTLQLPLAPNVSIMKDGQRASLDDIKEGDDVRATFDPTSKKILRLDIEVKGNEPIKMP